MYFYAKYEYSFNFNNMKKVFVSLFAAVVCAAGASAQTIVNNPDNLPYFGVRAGLDIACPGDMKSNGVGVDAFSNGAGFHVGAIYNKPVVANFYVEPGLSLYYNTYSINKNFAEAVELSDASIRKFGFRIPVMAGYHFDFTPEIKLHVFTGPEFEIGCVAKEHIEAANISLSESLYGEDGGMRRFNCLWDFGAALSYRKFQFGITGGLGMANMVDESGVTFHENRVSITLGYNF